MTLPLPAVMDNPGSTTVASFADPTGESLTGAHAVRKTKKNVLDEANPAIAKERSR